MLKKIYIFLGLIVAIIVIVGLDSRYRPKKVDPKLVQKAASNSPECNYPEDKYDPNRILTKEEFLHSKERAEACIKATIKYIKEHKN